MAYFHLGSFIASYQPYGTEIEDKDNTKALWEGDKESYETRLEIRCLVQALTPFLTATGISRSLVLGSELEELRLEEGWPYVSIVIELRGGA